MGPHLNFSGVRYIATLSSVQLSTLDWTLERIQL